MNLTSCDKCGLVYDRQNMLFPDTHDLDSQELIEDSVYWNGDEYIAKVLCECGNGYVYAKHVY